MGAGRRSARAGRAGLRRFLLTEANAAEAHAAGVVQVLPVSDLAHARQVLMGASPALPVPEVADPGPAAGPLDLADVRGQWMACRALEVAAAGGHNLLFIGPPGAGKTMLVRRLPSILPPLEGPERLESSVIASVAKAAPRAMKAPASTESASVLVTVNPAFATPRSRTRRAISSGA